MNEVKARILAAIVSVAAVAAVVVLVLIGSAHEETTPAADPWSECLRGYHMIRYEPWPDGARGYNVLCERNERKK